MIFYGKKAQNITQPYVILLILVVIGAISGIFFKFGQDLAGDPASKINDESRSYIFDRSGFDVEELESNDTTNLFFSTDTGSEGNLKDFAFEFNFFREQSSSFRTIFQSIYNIPSFFLTMFDISVNDDWRIVINIWNTFAWALIFYGIYRLIRGIIN